MPDLITFSSAHLLVAGGIVLLVTLLIASIYLRTVQHLQDRYQGARDHKRRSFLSRFLNRAESPSLHEHAASQGMIISDPTPLVRTNNDAYEGAVGTSSAAYAENQELQEQEEFELEDQVDTNLSAIYEWAESESEYSESAIDELESDKPELNIPDLDSEELADIEEENLENDPVHRKADFEQQDDQSYFVESFSSRDASRWERPSETHTDAYEIDSSDAFVDSVNQGGFGSIGDGIDADAFTTEELSDVSEPTESVTSENEAPSISMISEPDSPVLPQSEEPDETHTVSLLLIFEKGGKHFRSNPQPFIQCLRESGFVQLQDEFVLGYESEQTGHIAIHARNYERNATLAELAEFPANTSGFRIYFYSAEVNDAIAAMNVLSEIAYRMEVLFKDESYSFMPLKRYYDSDGVGATRLTKQALQNMEDDLRARYPAAGQQPKRVDPRTEEASPAGQKHVVGV